MINFLDVNNFKKGLIPVTTTEIFSKPGEFHPDGLFSENIFGAEETPERRKTFSYINLNANVIHPSAYILLMQLDRKIEQFITAQESFSLDSKGLLYKDPDGVTGILEFMKMFPKINFRGGTETRDKFVNKLKEAYKNGTLFLNIIPVIPPAQRDAYQDEKGMWIIDPLNDYYIAIIRRAYQAKSAEKSGPLFDLLNYELQKAVITHDNFIRKLIEKKRGLIRSQMLGKRTDFSGRAVITPGPNLKVNEIGIPFRMAVSLFEPFIIHRLFSGRIDQKKLSAEVKKFTQFELSIDSIKQVFKAIKGGDDDIPKELYKMIFEATEVAMMNRVVIAKRDPVLHAESVRGFKPILIEGNTVQLCTLQVGGFNADFDGDSSLCFINYKREQNRKCHIKDFLKKEKFIEVEKKEKSTGIIVTKYKPVNDLFIKAIDPKTGIINEKKIIEYSKHENIELYKIHDTKNRFEDFWGSYDHSLIIYDEDLKEIRKISPRELLDNPTGKFLIRERESE